MRIVRLLGVVAFLAAPLAAEAQQPGKLRLIGILSNGYAPGAPGLEDTTANFRKGLRDLGWVEGQNLAIEGRYGEGKADRLPALAQDLVRRGVEVIVVFAPAPIRVARNATRTIPIVMIASSSDPVGEGLVASLARPGGNITGLAWGASPEIFGKQLELLTEVLSGLSRIALLYERPLEHAPIREWEEVARRLSLTIPVRLVVRDPAEFEGTLAAITRQRAQAAYVSLAGAMYAHRQRLAELALKHRLPTFALLRELPEAGGLLSYGPSISEIYRRGAIYVDKILKGAKPADLPVEQPTRFELIVNLKTAKALGLTIPPSVLVRADEVIQ